MSDRVVSAYERSIARAEQKLGLNEGAQQRVAYSTVQAPQALSLRDRQAKPRHLEVLTLNSS